MKLRLIRVRTVCIKNIQLKIKKNTTQLNTEWTGPNDKSGKFYYPKLVKILHLLMARTRASSDNFGDIVSI